MSSENRSQLKTGQNALLPGAIEDSSDDDLVPLIEFGKATVEIDICGILRSVVGVVVGGSVVAFTESVVSKQCEVVVEALLDFDNSPFVKSVRFRAVLVVLHHEWTDDALNRWIVAGQPLSAAQRICSGGRR